MIDLAYSIADQNVATTKSIGIYNFSVDLLRHLSQHPALDRLTIFSNRTISLSIALSAKVGVKDCHSALAMPLGRMLWDQWGVYRQARATGHRWLFLPKGYCSFVARPPVRVAAFVHDIMRDFYDRRYPGFWPRLESLYFRRSLRATIEQAHVIFTNTEFSKSELLDLARRAGLKKPNVVVTGYGFDASDPGPTEKANRILLFASNMPHKRTATAIQFLNAWVQKSNYDGVIDCIGIVSPEMPKPSGDRWNWIGRVPPSQGREMIRRARGVVYFSEYEGFGMPPVEAVMEGTCPVFSDIPPLLEVMGSAGCSFSNDSPESFFIAMQNALATPAETIGAWSTSLRQRHNWQGVTQKIMDELSVASRLT